jgi:WXXGXW repeat (2 copies)
VKSARDAYNECMKTNIVDHADTKAVAAEGGTRTKLNRPLLMLVLISAALGIGGCEGYYSASPGYGPYYGGPNYGGPNYGGPYYGGGYPASVTVEVGDRPYYVRGPGYYVGSTYYVWRPGHWASRHGQRVWIHGHYVVRGY